MRSYKFLCDPRDWSSDPLVFTFESWPLVIPTKAGLLIALGIRGMGVVAGSGSELRSKGVEGKQEISARG